MVSTLTDLSGLTQKGRGVVLTAWNSSSQEDLKKMAFVSTIRVSLRSKPGAMISFILCCVCFSTHLFIVWRADSGLAL